MIVAAACIPQPPLLLPGLTGGPVAEVEELRAHIQQAVTLVVEQASDEVIVVGAAPTTGHCPRDAPAPAGRLAPAADRRPEQTPLPLPLVIGRAALEGHQVSYVLQGVEASAPPARCHALGVGLARGPGRTALLVAADGSARRGEKAAGHLDPRAPALDDQVARALDNADTTALLALDPQLCADLLLTGRAHGKYWPGPARAARGRQTAYTRQTPSASPTT
ncbi:hypothetical protein ACQPZP_32525 [Spirillospora sp. CA-142024]|uniref:hypothetical protein n=1 Tax=Spirillospora sp. CA-142024 TaxID=3240036 RepID=UPI003D938493